MICDTCLAIVYHEGYKKDPPERLDSVRHHSCYADVESSDKKGCKICSFLRQVLFNHRPGHPFSSFEDAEAYQKRLDQVLEQPFFSHQFCSAAISTPLPSRILELGAPGETHDVRLKVNAGISERYATLSHCWGESQPLKLTRSTFEEFRTGIAFESLPRTFQDAVTAAQSLELKYLSIDSLCIVQDSKEDWEEQCTAMRQIYKYSFVTLAALGASDCNAGFLRSRSLPLKVDFQLSDGASVFLSHHGCADYPYDGPPNRQDYMRSDKRDYRPLTEQNLRLFKRAWILQERLLSSRVLYLSTSRMYLECFTNNRYEDCHYPTPGPDKLLSNNVAKWKSEQLGNELQRFSHWEHLVVRYSNMNLTYRTDRLPALSGLASEFHRVTKATYLAGHWIEDLNLGWFVMPQGQSKAALSGSEYVAPSWSRDSSNAPIEFYRPWEDPKGMVFYHRLRLIRPSLPQELIRSVL
ncbi:hypothetical protein HYALB_00008241 [Hymenoscyphus albidus]|uniref:Heterokaryon incompatibility domain-containing protein n=1 Tax=Hymenoscyphus albidus TaxID=595503 RepID=A0A9N9LHY0_9HELO|nr:hypothetical protein HYALB_00008241 [Hymenoscyphus albidus]